MGCSGRALGRSWLSLGDLLGPSGCSWGALGELLEALSGLLEASWGQLVVSHVSLFQRGLKTGKLVGRFWLQKGSDFETTLKRRNVGNQKLAPRGPLRRPRDHQERSWSDLGTFLVPADKPKMVKIQWFYHYFCKIASWIKNVLRKASWTQLEATWATKSAKWPSKRCPKNVQEELKIASKKGRKKRYQNRGPRHRLAVLLLGFLAPWGGVGEGKNKQ